MKRRSFVGALIASCLMPFRRLAEALCNPALVEGTHPGPTRVQVRPRAVPRLGEYYLQWFGHSSFLIHSGSQTKVVTDPNLYVTPGIEADAVTVSNDHITHNNVEAVAGPPVILRGITARQAWNPIRTSIKDIVIVNLPSRRGAAWGGAANSIFVYEMGSLCLAHLGNIGHLLTPEQQKVLQRVDVMMIPIDALTNLGFEELARLIDQVRPPIVIPMHYDIPRQGELFAEFIASRYPVRRLDSSRLRLSRSMLPPETEIFVLAHPRPERWGE